jgi:hypothetical protein
MESESEQQRNQNEFKELVKKYGLTNKQAAELIEKQTNQNISERKLRTWLADPALISSRAMPNWAITGLKEATRKIKEEDIK